jgi:ABC-type multidrug transport system fused ATPase/permease subunit
VIALLFYPKNNRQLKTWFLLHLGIGSLGLISKFFVIIWFYLVLIQAFAYIFSARSVDAKHLRIINLLLYIAPFEIITRIEKCSPLIPYELGKYITFILLLWGLSFSKHTNKIGYILIALLVPGIILGWPKAPDYRHIIFNIFGLINLGMGIAYFGGLYLNKTKFDVNNGIRLLTYSLFVALIYTFFKTPDYDEIDFNLGANFEASGGFGSNQVSTAFGLGMFLCFYLWKQGTSFSGFGRFVDLALSGLFLFQGLLTFSRGGIIGGVLALLLFILWSQRYSATGVKNRLKYVNLGKIIFFSIPFLIMLTLFANSTTNGNLLLRYQGETEGTLYGSKENDLNNFTTGRMDLFLEDWKIFIKYPIFGSGVSVSSQIRTKDKGTAAHVELSRLLAEHGIFGMLIFLMLLFKLFSLIYKREPSLLILLVLFVIGFYTTFHAATRTFLSPLLMSIAFLPLKLLKR